MSSNDINYLRQRARLRAEILRLEQACKDESDYWKRFPLIAEFERAVGEYKRLVGLRSHQSVFDYWKTLGNGDLSDGGH